MHRNRTGSDQRSASGWSHTVTPEETVTHPDNAHSGSRWEPAPTPSPGPDGTLTQPAGGPGHPPRPPAEGARQSPQPQSAPAVPAVQPPESAPAAPSPSPALAGMPPS